MPKSYSAYKYADIPLLGLSFERRDFVNNTPILEPSELLTAILKSNAPMAINTEKAKSEFLIAPILYEIARKNYEKISFFSGYPLDVDKNLGLKGFCDFLFTKTPRSPVIKEPIFCIVEAKNDNPENGVPQCVAEMYAARLFNEQNNKSIDVIYGCVTTGYLWQFLKLEQQIVLQDTTVYSLAELSSILGILQFIVEQ
jgi:hypothetical protein